MATRKKIKPRTRRIINSTLVVLLLCGMGGAICYWYNKETPNFVTYPQLGIPLPNNFTIHGIDVSHHQQVINWALVQSMQVQHIKIGFCFIKATQGLEGLDAQFKRNWSKARQNGITRGAYHFFIATKSGKLQAQHFMEEVTLQKGDLPPVLDVEQTFGVPPDKLKKEAQIFLAALQQHYGIAPIIYTNVDFYKQYLGPAFDAYPLWAAHYLQPSNPRVSRSWLFWQHSESGRVNGIITPVDFNVFYGDSANFKQVLVQ
jgi:lysozyme